MARRIGYTVRRLSSGRYQLLVRAEDGKQIGMGSYPSKQDAERAGLAAATQVRSHLWVDPRQSDITVAQAIEAWRDRQAATGRHSAHHTRNVQSILRRHILPYRLARILLTDLKPAHVADWYDELAANMRSQPRGKLVAPKCYRIVHAALEDAVRRQQLAINPCNIRDGGREQSDERPLVTPAQVALLAGNAPPRFTGLVLTAAWAGLRFGELQRLERADIDLLHGTLRVRQAKSQAGVRTVHLAPQLVAVLDRHMTAHVLADPSAPVFTGVRGGRLSQQVLRGWWPDLCVSCGLPDLHLHDLRHHAATAYALTGATTKEIMEHIGHSTQSASIRYQHVAATRRPELAAAIGALWVEPEQAPPVNVRKIRRAAR